MSGARPARIADAPAIGRIEVESWRATYAGMLPDRLLLTMSAERQARCWAGLLRHAAHGVWVWEEAAAGVLGFGHCGRQRHADLPYDGEVFMLYVHPDAQGQGVGRGLLMAMFEAIAAAGGRSALVWVVRANPARFFYERQGARLALTRRIPVGGVPVEALGYAWDDLPALLERRGPVPRG